MCWYKSGRRSIAVFIGALAFVGSLPACKPAIENNGAFDLKGFFTKEIARLSKLNQAVVKTVTHNSVSETKTVHITDWAQELAFFVDADINKPGWKNNYNFTDEDSLWVYRAKDPDLKVQELLINHKKQQIKWILIYTRTQNKLYYSAKKLTYFPDSVYRIGITQRVRLMGGN